MVGRFEKQYIATAELRAEVFQYTNSTVNNKVVGVFTAPYAIGAGQAVSIPAGTILETTGKKLFPGANPNVPSLLVQVMAYTPSATPTILGVPGTVLTGSPLLDGGAPQRRVVGFVDPNSPLLAIYSIEKPNHSEDGLYYSTLGALTLGGAATTLVAQAAAGGVAHRGNSVWTGGSVTAGNGLVVGAGIVQKISAATFTATGGAVDTTTGSVFLATTTLTGAATFTVTGPVGSTFAIYITNGGGQTVTLATAAGGTVPTSLAQIVAAGPGGVILAQGAPSVAITTANRGVISGVITVAA